MSAAQSWAEALFELDPNGRVHAYGHDTEQAAAESMAEVSGRLRLQVLALLREAGEHGLTDDEGGRLMDGDRLTFGRRRNELALAGLVRDSGRRRPAPTGRTTRVWVLVGEQA